jgi:hypothetical protein
MSLEPAVFPKRGEGFDEVWDRFGLPGKESRLACASVVFASEKNARRIRVVIQTKASAQDMVAVLGQIAVRFEAE